MRLLLYLSFKPISCLAFIACDMIHSDFTTCSRDACKHRSKNATLNNPEKQQPIQQQKVQREACTVTQWCTCRNPCLGHKPCNVVLSLLVSQETQSYGRSPPNVKRGICVCSADTSFSPRPSLHVIRLSRRWRLPRAGRHRGRQS